MIELKETRSPMWSSGQKRGVIKHRRDLAALVPNSTAYQLSQYINHLLSLDVSWATQLPEIAHLRLIGVAASRRDPCIPGPPIVASARNLAVSLAGTRLGGARAGSARRPPQGAEGEIGFEDEVVDKGEHDRATPKAFGCFCNYHGARHAVDGIQDEVKPAPERKHHGTDSRRDYDGMDGAPA
ncbi:hypothetical protein PG985_011606 [Apiospora marii]|uniref:uncharacterized protein n=1 Tax=Apiospora marii TaxID=335849 RepID=UPI00312E9CEF